jgi:hypothetical protein
MTTANPSVFSFVVTYRDDATEITIEADHPHDACVLAFERTAEHVRPGWRNLIPCGTLAMRSPSSFELPELVQAARARAFVRLTDGTLARLVYWAPPGRGRKVRVELRPGVQFTFKPDKVAAVGMIPTTANTGGNNQ